MKRTINYAMSALIAFAPLTSYAFKIDTHVWIGQQIINDLEDDGKLSLRLGDQNIEIDVNDDVTNAILSNKSAFLMGNIGPDAAPDVVVGQTTVHPGVKDADGVNIGWQTNQWLEHLMRASEGSEIGSAYTYGYLGHAAADVFAHSYVNQYAGDIFNLVDETLVEERHFVLEGFIGKLTPKLKNNLGQDLGSAADLVAMNDELAEFIRDNLIYDRDVEEQYWKVPTAYHLAAYAKFRRGIDDIAEDGIWHDIDIAILVIVAAYFDIELTPEEAGEIVDAAQPVFDFLHGDIPDALQDVTNVMYENASKFEEAGFEKVSAAVDRMQTLESSLLESKRKLVDELSGLDSRLRDKSCGVIDEALEDLVNIVSSINDVVDPYGIADPLGVTEGLVEHIRDNPTEPFIPGLDKVKDILGFGDNDWSYSYTGTSAQFLSEGQEYLAMADFTEGRMIWINTSQFKSDFGAEFGEEGVDKLNGALVFANYLATGEKPSILFGNTIDITEGPEFSDIEVASYVISTFRHLGARFTNFASLATGDGTYTISDSNRTPASLRENESGFMAMCNELNNLADNVRDLHLDAIRALEDKIIKDKADFIEAAIDLRDETVAAAEALHNLQNAITDLHQLISADVSPIQSVLRGWRSDVDIAMTEYVKAANQAMVNTMDPTKSSLEPLEKWFECYHESIIGIPSSISGCGQIKDSIGDLMGAIEGILKVLDEIATLGSPIPGAADLLNLKDKLIDDLTDKLKEKIGEKIEDMIPEEIREIMELLGADMNDATLNQYFTKAETISPAKGLIMIPDMADRVRAEMSITAEDTFDPEKYAVIHNAVVLAKLALLDKYGYEQLALLAGSNDYYEYFADVDNLVAQAFGNIDGNHQWMPLPPPIPNALSNYPAVDYTYSSDRSEVGEDDGLGFMFWKDDMRDKIFRKLFIGPLSPGIDAPGLIGEDRIVDQSYPYQPCYANPFPDDIEDRICISIILIPILSILLN